MIQLIPSQIEEFHRNGFLVVRNLITSEEIEELLASYEKAVSGEIEVPTFGGDKPQGGVVQLAHPSRHIPGWREHAYFKSALSISRQLLGEDLAYNYDQIIYKPAQTRGETHWHQDAAYWKGSEAEERGVTCWLSLGESFRENGGMQFVEGSHLSPLQEHFSIAAESQIANALATHVDASQAVACTLRPGDASFHHCRTLHYTGHNESDVPRHGLITHFAPEAK